MPTPTEYKRFFSKRGIEVSVEEINGHTTIIASRRHIPTITKILSDIQQEGKYIITIREEITPFWKKLLFWVKD